MEEQLLSTIHTYIYVYQMVYMYIAYIYIYIRSQYRDNRGFYIHYLGDVITP